MGNTALTVSFEEAQAMLVSDRELENAISRVTHLDFTMLKYKLSKERAWTSEHCDNVESLYRQFLVLNARYPDRKICPTGPVDEFWHAHILDTRAYERDCWTVFGKYLHHFPYFGMRGPEDYAALQENFQDSRELYILHFGFDPAAGDAEARRCSSQRCP